MTTETETHWLGTTGNRSGSILVIGEYPSTEEARRGMPFVSAAGTALRQLLSFAKIPMEEVLLTTLAKTYPARGAMTEFFYSNKEAKKLGMMAVDGLYPGKEMQQWREGLLRIVEEMKPEFIISLGSYPMWVLGEEGFDVQTKKGFSTALGMKRWRGSQLHTKKENIPLLPTFSEKDMLRVHPWLFQGKHDISVRYGMWKKGAWLEGETNFIVRPSLETVHKTLSTLLINLEVAAFDKVKYPISVDIETRVNHIACIGFAWSSSEAICIPFMTVDGDNNYWNLQEEIAVLELIIKILTHPSLTLRGQNFLFDAQFINFYWRVKPYITEDTMIMQHLLFPGTELNLGYLSSLYCKYHRYWKDDGKEWKKDMNEEKLWVYNCRDCAVTFEIAESLNIFIKHNQLFPQWKFQQRQLQSLLTVMLRGVAINLETKHNAMIKLDVLTEQHAEKLEAMMPESVHPRDPKLSPWYTSSVQITKIFHETFGLKRYWSKKKKGYTVDNAALTNFAKAEPILRHLCQTLQEFRSFSTFKTFTHMKLDIDNRMRTSYSPTASTFRYKSSANVFHNGGNLQNLPKGTEE